MFNFTAKSITGLMPGMSGMLAKSVLMNGSQMFSSAFNFALFVLLIVAQWRMYEKAGEEGWAAIIPYYSSYMRFKIAGQNKLFLPALICIIALPILSLVDIFLIVNLFFETNIRGAVAAFVIVMLLSAVAFILLIIFKIIVCVGLSKNFGKGAGHGVGLFFLPYIFYPLLAFSSSIEYVGGYGDVPPVTGDRTSNYYSNGEYAPESNGNDNSSLHNSSDAANRSTNNSSSGDSMNTGNDINDGNNSTVESSSLHNSSSSSNADIEVVENVRSADVAPEKKEFTNDDEFNEVFKNAINSTSDSPEHVSGDVE